MYQSTEPLGQILPTAIALNPQASGKLLKALLMMHSTSLSI